MPSIKLNTLADFERLLKRAVSISHCDSIRGLDLVVRSFIPFVNTNIHVDLAELKLVWPDAKRAVSTLEHFLTFDKEKYGIAFLRDALLKTRAPATEQFWMLERGVFNHSDINEILVSPDSRYVYVGTKNGQRIGTNIDVIAANNERVAQLLTDVSDLKLSPRQLWHTVNDECFSHDGHRHTEVIRAIPSAVSDIISLSSIDETRDYVVCLVKEHENKRPRYYIAPLKDLEEKFPKITQALIATSAVKHCSTALRASFIRRWWEVLQDTMDPVLFYVGDPEDTRVRPRQYSRRHDSDAAVYKWSSLLNVTKPGPGGMHLLTFKPEDENKERPAYIYRTDAQSHFLGLDKTFDMLDALDINGREAAGPVRAVLCNTSPIAHDVLMPDFDSDFSLDRT